MVSMLSKLKTRFSFQVFIPSFVAGVILGILEISIMASCAAMIFSGELEGFLSRGIGIILYGAFVMGTVVTTLGTFIPSIAVPQDVPIAILAIIAAAITKGMDATNPEQKFITVVAAMMLSTLLTGIAFWLMGRFNLGRLVRYIPYPVVGGFLGGTGWFLFIGGIGVMTNTPLSLALFQPDILLLWLPGFIFGAVLYILLRHYSHFLLMPAVLLGGIFLFYLVYYFSSGSVSSAGLDGWLLGPFPQGGLFRFMILEAATNANWPIVFENIINMSTIIIVSTISLLLNASGLEIASEVDIDLNRELKTTGIANLLAGLGGSPVGFHALSSSILAQRLGAKSRLVGLIFSAVIGFTLFFGASALAVFPKMIAGGLLIFLGFSFLIEWLYDAWFKLPKLDYLLIWLILVVIASIGFLEGVAVGILVATIVFVVNYSRINVIHHAATGTNYHSHIMRPRLYRQLLRQRGDIFIILKLQGYIFFGTADRLVAQIKKRLDDPELPRLQYLLLDFQLVTGIDSSASLSFSKLKQLIENQGITLVFTGLSPGIKVQMEREVFGSEPDEHLRTFPDLDQGVAWCENCLIAVFTEVGLVAKPKTILQLVEESLSPPQDENCWLTMNTPGVEGKPSSTASRMLKYLEYIEAEQGDCFIEEGDRIQGLYFIEDGQITSMTPSTEGTGILRVTLEAGTVFGEIGFYTEQCAITTLTCSCDGKLYYLSAENFKRMEAEDPEMAIAFHRIVSKNMGSKLALSSDIVRALSR